ncbi:MAG: LysR family transcriptional regulator [Pseudomonadota bacterium]
MRAEPSLDDIALFLSVAQTGSLSASARVTGIPVPTLSRRMTAMERQTGRRLFLRGADGYALSAEGRAFREEAQALSPLADRLKRWLAKDIAPPRVKITAGSWTSRFLACSVRKFWKTDDGWLPEFLACSARMDIARREADIGITNRRPDQAWLAGRRTITIRYATYGIAGCGPGYVSLADTAPETKSDRWLRTTHPDLIVTTANDVRVALDLALAGIGRIIMPTFAAGAEPDLHQLAPPIDELTHDEWLISHHEARNDPPVRQALDALYAALTDRTLRP